MQSLKSRLWECMGAWCMCSRWCPQHWMPIEGVPLEIDVHPLPLRAPSADLSAEGGQAQARDPLSLSSRLRSLDPMALREALDQARARWERQRATSKHRPELDTVHAYTVMPASGDYQVELKEHAVRPPAPKVPYLRTRHIRALHRV